jgi:hypothetical protein
MSSIAGAGKEGFMTGRHRRSRHIVFIAALLFGALGCGSSTAESYGTAVAASQSKSDAKKPNACVLVDREDMERLAKGKVTLLHDIVAEGQTNCEVYRDGDTKSPVIVVEVHWTGGKELARKEKLAAGQAKRAPGEKTVDIEALTAPASVPRADDAYYAEGKASWVLKGDVMFRLSMPGLGGDDRQKNFVPLARKALAKLP